MEMLWFMAVLVSVPVLSGIFVILLINALVGNRHPAPDTAHTRVERYDTKFTVGEDEMFAVASAMAVSVGEARRIFDHVGPETALQIVRNLGMDLNAQQTIIIAATRNLRWWDR